jgi:hypothetical protein
MNTFNNLVSFDPSLDLFVPISIFKHISRCIIFRRT